MDTRVTRWRHLILRAVVPVCDRQGMLLAAAAPVIVALGWLGFTPSLFRDEVGQMVIRETLSFTGAGGMLLLGITAYMISLDQSRGYEEMDLSFGVKAYIQHLLACAAATAAAAMVYAWVAVAALAMGFFCRNFSMADQIAWLASMLLVFPLLWVLAQGVGIILRVLRQPMAGYLTAGVITAIGVSWDPHELFAAKGTLETIVRGIGNILIPDIDWTARGIGMFAYAAPAASSLHCALAGLGLCVQAVFLFIVLRLTPLSRDYAERSRRVWSDARSFLSRRPRGFRRAVKSFLESV